MSGLADGFTGCSHEAGLIHRMLIRFYRPSHALCTFSRSGRSLRTPWPCAPAPGIGSVLRRDFAWPDFSPSGELPEFLLLLWPQEAIASLLREHVLSLFWSSVAGTQA